MQTVVEDQGLAVFPDIRRLRWLDGVLELWDADGARHVVGTFCEEILLLGRSFAALALPEGARRVYLGANFPEGQELVIEHREDCLALAISPKPKGNVAQA